MTTMTSIKQQSKLIIISEITKRLVESIDSYPDNKKPQWIAYYNEHKKLPQWKLNYERNKPYMRNYMKQYTTKKYRENKTRYECKLCDKSFPTKATIKTHCKSKLHLKLKYKIKMDCNKTLYDSLKDVYFIDDYIVNRDI